MKARRADTPTRKPAAPDEVARGTRKPDGQQGGQTAAGATQDGQPDIFTD